jgi:hypothetical protein
MSGDERLARLIDELGNLRIELENELREVEELIVKLESLSDRLKAAQC